MDSVVQIYDLCKFYRSGTSIIEAVSRVSMTIDKGEFVAIIGRSGSGKSTLMSILGLLERADTGRYFLEGNDTAGFSEDARAALRSRKIGFVFQLPALLARASALENIELPLNYCNINGAKAHKLAYDALNRVGLRHRGDHYPNQLSGGEQQRVSIARAIVNNPTLILADEPTGSLDSRTSDEILSLFTELNREGHTVLVITHAAEVARCVDRRITLHDGKVIQDDRQEQST
jgi:putative ABC transport system ATP-binding protein